MNRLSRVTATYSIDTNYFKSIDTPNKAYFLGLLYSDGSISTKGNKIGGFSIGLQEQDRHILESFLKDMKSNHKLRIKKPSTKLDRKVSGRNITSHKNICRMNISSIEMANDLIKLGCVPRKSLILKFPTSDQVPSELIHHFIRGYFDGDGTAHFSKRKIGIFGIIGTYDVCSFINQILISKGIKSIEPTKVRENDKNTYKCYYAGNLKCRLFYDYIYKDAEMFLVRKYNILKKSYTEGRVRKRSSNHRGVIKRSENRWIASLYFNKSIHYLGEFKTENEAAKTVNNFIKGNIETSYSILMPEV